MESEKNIEIRSEKYGIDGIIQDDVMVKKLIFKYNGRKHVIGIANGYNESLAEKGTKILEMSIEMLMSERDDVNERKVFLHYWYLSAEEEKIKGHGNVTGHSKINDTVKISTSRVMIMEFDEENG